MPFVADGSNKRNGFPLPRECDHPQIEAGLGVKHQE